MKYEWEGLSCEWNSRAASNAIPDTLPFVVTFDWASVREPACNIKRVYEFSLAKSSCQCDNQDDFISEQHC